MTFLGLSAVAVLLVTLAIVRAEARPDAQRGAMPPLIAWQTKANPREWALVLGVVLVAQLPVLLLALSDPHSAPGDSLTHAIAARELVQGGLGRGWIHSLLGGFPYAVHYPPLGTLLIALGIGLGVEPLLATHLTGVLSVLSVPLVVAASLLRAQIRPAYALIGGLVVAWVAPYNGFVGGFETFFSIGLVSQVVALPLATLFVASLALGQRAWPSVLFGVLTSLAHPQIAIATIVVSFPALLVALPSRALLLRMLRTAAAVFAVSLAVYGPGLVQLGVPFGWPSGMAWRLLGFPLSRLDPLLFDGWLVDYRRARVLTALAAVSAIALLVSSRRGVARAALSALALALALSVSGQSLLHSGPLGRWMLSAVQPLRVTALVPLAVALVIAVALEEATAQIDRARALSAPRALARGWRTASAALALAPLVALTLLPALAERAATASVFLELRRGYAEAPCGEATPSGYDGAGLRRALASLSQGRLWYDASGDGFVSACADVDALVLASAIPIANTAALGAHVGVEWSAAAYLAPDTPGGRDRAEALGIRYALAPADARWNGFQPSARVGPIAILEREGERDLVGAGCVIERWRGSDAALRERLVAELQAPSLEHRSLDPSRFVELVPGEGPLVVEPSGDRCDASSARVRERVTADRIDAEVTSEAPVDVVLRVTASPSWRVSVDDAPVDTSRMVSPGFIVVSVPPGRHTIRAVVGWQRGYGLGLLAGLALALAAALERRAKPMSGKPVGA